MFQHSRVAAGKDSGIVAVFEGSQMAVDTDSGAVGGSRAAEGTDSGTVGVSESFRAAENVRSGSSLSDSLHYCFSL